MPTLQQQRLVLPPPTALRYTRKVRSIAPLNLIGYWPLAESGGPQSRDESGNNQHGTYASLDTLGVAGISDGRTAVSFNGASYYVDVHAIASVFSGVAGTLAGWVQVPVAGTWTDSTFREFVRFLVDGSNFVLIDKSSTANGIRFVYNAGGANKNLTDTSLGGSLGWFHAGITWDKAADQVKAYINGAQAGATLTGLGTWAGIPGVQTTCLGAAATTDVANNHKGNLAHWALWNAALSAGQIAALATVP